MGLVDHWLRKLNWGGEPVSAKREFNNACTFCNSEIKPGTPAIVKKDQSASICAPCNQTFQGMLYAAVHQLDRDQVEEFSKQAHELDVLRKPDVIRHDLDQYVVGQDDAKRVLAVAAHNHYKRIRLSHAEGNSVEVDRGNILLLGPTGSGKTLLVETLAKTMNVPYAVVDATTFSSAGLIGKHFDEVMEDLLMAAKGDVEWAEKGIIFIDEIDKIAEGGKQNGSTDMGERVQKTLLAPMQGCDVNVTLPPAAPGAPRRIIAMSTKNIMFICAGAFVGLEDTIRQRIAEKGRGNGVTLGFGSEPVVAKKLSHEELLGKMIPEDLEKFGIIRELAARLHQKARTMPLSQDNLVSILTKPKNALVKQYETLFAMDNGPVLRFEEDALQAVARSAHVEGTGARALRGVLEKVLSEAQYEQPDVAEIIVTAASVNEGVKPVYVSHEEAAIKRAEAQKNVPPPVVNDRRAAIAGMRDCMPC